MEIDGSWVDCLLVGGLYRKAKALLYQSTPGQRHITWGEREREREGGREGEREREREREGGREGGREGEREGGKVRVSEANGERREGEDTYRREVTHS